MTTEYVDLTPTWAGLLHGLLSAYEHGSQKGRAIAYEELMRMAKAADLAIAMAAEAAKKTERENAE